MQSENLIRISLISLLRRPGNRLVGIRVRYPAEYRSSVDKLKSLLITSHNGTTVPLTGRLSGRDLGSAMFRSFLFLLLRERGL